MRNRNTQRKKRHIRVRSKISGTTDCPRMAVYRSNYGIYVQLIDDTLGKTLIGIRSNKKNNQAATELGKKIAEQAIKQKISTVVFDRGGYMYHGTIKSLADAAREGGLKF